MISTRRSPSVQTNSLRLQNCITPVIARPLTNPGSCLTSSPTAWADPFSPSRTPFPRRGSFPQTIFFLQTYKWTFPTPFFRGSNCALVPRNSYFFQNSPAIVDLRAKCPKYDFIKLPVEFVRLLVTFHCEYHLMLPSCDKYTNIFN